MTADATPYPEISFLIDGSWTRSDTARTRPILDPATDRVLGELCIATESDLDRAAQAAADAFRGWADTPAVARGRILRNAANLLRERVEEIARNMTLEQGKPIAESRMEVAASADIFDWFAEEGRRAYGRLVPSAIPGVDWAVHRQPVGPVAAFTPWNFPGIIPARKIAAALATGCTLVLKPAEETPATAMALAQALVDAGLPKGVLNIVFGDPAMVSSHLIAHPAIRKISFTGSTNVGLDLAAQAARAGAKRCTMELGGHAPVIICEDADVAAAAKVLAASKFRNAGQVCISPTRFFVGNGVFDEFLSEFTLAVKAISVGNGLDAQNQMGPLAHDRRVGALSAFVEDAQQNGATLVTGGARIGNAGQFYAPTILTDVPQSARIMQEEPFGPVAPLTRVSSLDEAIALANSVPYGLASYAFTILRQGASPDPRG